jgi:hypothetical protein
MERVTCCMGVLLVELTVFSALATGLRAADRLLFIGLPWLPQSSVSQNLP